MNLVAPWWLLLLVPVAGPCDRLRHPAATTQRLRGPLRRPCQCSNGWSPRRARLAAPHAAGVPRRSPRPARARRRTPRDGPAGASGAGHRHGRRRLRRCRCVPPTSSRPASRQPSTRRAPFINGLPDEYDVGVVGFAQGGTVLSPPTARPRLGRSEPRHRHPRGRHGHRRRGSSPRSARCEPSPSACARTRRPASSCSLTARTRWAVARRRSGCRGRRWDPGHDHRLRRRRQHRSVPRRQQRGPERDRRHQRGHRLLRRERRRARGRLRRDPVLDRMAHRGPRRHPVRRRAGLPARPRRRRPVPSLVLTPPVSSRHHEEP